MNEHKLIRLFLIAAIAFSLGMASMAYFRELPKCKAKTNTVVISCGDTLSIENLRKYCVKIGMKHPDAVVSHAVIESGNGISWLGYKCHNLFGMTYPTKRKTLAIGKTDSQYCIYSTWEDCVKDYRLWQEPYDAELDTVVNYFDFLRRKEYF